MKPPGTVKEDTGLPASDGAIWTLRPGVQRNTARRTRRSGGVRSGARDGLLVDWRSANRKQ